MHKLSSSGPPDLLWLVHPVGNQRKGALWAVQLDVGSTELLVKATGH